jgi:tetratricopeptide (TPR) repeat protein
VRNVGREAPTKGNIAEVLYQAADNDQWRSEVLLLLGSAYLAVGKYPKAIERLDRALAIAERTKNSVTLLGAMSVLGTTY